MQQGYEPRHGPQQQPRVRHHHGPGWQSGHPQQPTSYHFYFFRDASVHRKWTILSVSISYHSILSLTTIVPDCPVLQSPCFVLFCFLPQSSGQMAPGMHVGILVPLSSSWWWAGPHFLLRAPSFCFLNIVEKLPCVDLKFNFATVSVFLFHLALIFPVFIVNHNLF